MKSFLIFFLCVYLMYLAKGDTPLDKTVRVTTDISTTVETPKPWHNRLPQTILAFLNVLSCEKLDEIQNRKNERLQREFDDIDRIAYQVLSELMELHCKGDEIKEKNFFIQKILNKVSEDRTVQQNYTCNTAMAVYDNNILNISVNTPAIRSLNNNSGNFTSNSRYCHIANCSSNKGYVSVASYSTVAIIRRNMGNISLMYGTNVGSIDQNCGNCTLMELGNAGKIDRNAGNVTLSERNSIGVIEHNSGIVVVKASSDICKIKANFGTIYIHDNCTIGVIEGNNGMINLGNNCDVKSIIGSGGNLQWGFGSKVPPAQPPPTEGPSIPHYFYSSVNVNDVTGAQTFNYIPPPQPSGNSFFVNGIDMNCMMTGTQTFTCSMPQNNLQQPPSPAPLIPQNTEEEDQSICEDLICAICMVNKKNIVFNCGHTSCDSCSNALIYCHICRQNILQKIKLYL